MVKGMKKSVEVTEGWEGLFEEWDIGQRCSEKDSRKTKGSSIHGRKILFVGTCSKISHQASVKSLGGHSFQFDLLLLYK